ncbi:MAG: hypothetical protein HYS57_01615 [Parcubacteria group bacterium]|nr:hypothetical protein [Parcubacteria group bacterium]
MTIESPQNNEVGQIKDKEAKVETSQVSVKLEAIAELREPIQRILSQIGDLIERGEYGLIIGEDASGRIPALIFDRVIRRIYRDKGYLPPETRFVAGGTPSAQDVYAIKAREVTNMLEATKTVLQERLVGQRVLVVTDTISFGTSLGLLASVLRENGFVFDIATIGVVYPNRVGQQERDFGGDIYWGFEGTPSVYGQNYFSGVRKEQNRSFSKPYKLDEYVPFGTVVQKTPPEVGMARAEAAVLAGELVEWFGAQRANPQAK